MHDNGAVPALALLSWYDLLIGLVPLLLLIALVTVWILWWSERSDPTLPLHLLRFAQWLLLAVYLLVAVNNTFALHGGERGASLRDYLIATFLLAPLELGLAAAIASLLLRIALHQAVHRSYEVGEVVRDRAAALAICRCINQARWLHACLDRRRDVPVATALEWVCPT